MRNILIAVFIILSFYYTPVSAREYLYILNDSCINELHNKAQQALTNSQIDVIRDPLGIILRFELPHPEEEYKNLSVETTQRISAAISFLAKIKNPAIIEVHTENISKEKLKGHKNWEVSTVIANHIESVFSSRLDYNRIDSVGYGEFLPAKNTSNNGVNYPNRVDIIIICNISGE